MRRWLPVVAMLGLCVGGLELASRVGEYESDAGPAVNALISGNLHRFLAVQPLMGGFAVLAQAPFAFAAKLAGAGELGTYRAGVLACLLAAAAVGLGLVRERGLRPEAELVVPALAVLTPASLVAVRDGHPEEILGGALCIAAMLLAGRRAVWAGVALGLAVATKQWALVAVVPVAVPFVVVPLVTRVAVGMRISDPLEILASLLFSVRIFGLERIFPLPESCMAES